MAQLSAMRYGDENVGGLIIQCGFCSFKQVATHLFGKLAKYLVSEKWKNGEMLSNLMCPVLILHGRKDTLIPPEQAQKLWDAVPNKLLSVLTCSRNTTVRSDKMYNYNRPINTPSRSISISDNKKGMPDLQLWSQRF